MKFIFRLIAGVITAAVMIGVTSLTPATAPIAAAAEKTPEAVATETSSERITELEATLAARSSEIAELTATSSEKSNSITSATEAVADAQARVTQARTALATLDPEIVIVSAFKIESLIDEAHAALEGLEDAYAAWNDAVAEARAEREAREAAKKAAAEQAAKERATAAAHAAKPSPSASAPKVYTVRPVGVGHQALVDKCIGPVWIRNLPMYLAEHWHCGGSTFPKHAGAIVKIPDVGTFKSVGIIIQLNGPKSSFKRHVPKGYDLYYQTCLNNNPATTGIVGFKRIK